MSGTWSLLATTMIVYVTTAMIACWGLDLQFGYTGVVNFSFIIFEAAGAYTAAILTLGPPQHGGFQDYLFGARLPFPLPWVAAGLAGAALGLVVGVIALRRLRGDYEAMVMLVISLIAIYFVSARTDFLNGTLGLSLVPAPFQSELGLSRQGYAWFYAALSVAACGFCYLVMRRIVASPLCRALRAVRDNEKAALALGRNAPMLRLLVFAVGGAMGAVAGAITVQSIGAWSPGAWTYSETFILFAAIIVGGRANLAGVGLGALLVPGLIIEGVVFLPAIGSSSLTASLQWIVVGALIIGFLWFRPEGVIPERRRNLSAWTAAPAGRSLRRGRSRRQAERVGS